MIEVGTVSIYAGFHYLNNKVNILLCIFVHAKPSKPYLNIWLLSFA